MRSRLRVMFGVVLGLTLAFGLLLSVAKAGSLPVYILNQPFEKIHVAAGRTMVPFADFMAAVKKDWSIDKDSCVTCFEGAGVGPAPESNIISFAGRANSSVMGYHRNGEYWVPLKETAEALGFVVTFSEAGYVDVCAPRNLTAHERQVAENIERENAERAEAERLAREKAKEERLAAEAAAEEEAEAEAEEGDSAKAVAGKSGKKVAKSAEGALPAEFEKDAPKAEKKAPARRKADRDLRPGEIATIENMQQIQREIDQEENEEALEASKGSGSAAAKASDSASKDEEEPAPVPHLVVVGENAIADFNGHIVMSAVVRNVGGAPAEGVSLTFTLRGPDGSVWRTQTVRTSSVSPAGSWNARYEYDHLDGSSVTRGTLTVSTTINYNKK